jgi:hypothetical protein
MVLFICPAGLRLKHVDRTTERKTLSSPVMIPYMPILQGSYNKAHLVLVTFKSITTPITGNKSKMETHNK